MIEEALFGIGLVASVCTWKWVWKASALDHTRDQLFDLRDVTVRDFFLARPGGLNDPAYRTLRDLLNSHLRYTDSASFYMFAWVSAQMADEGSALSRNGREKVESRLQEVDPATMRFVESIRGRAAAIMLEYMLQTSVSSLLLMFFLLPFALASRLFDGLRTPGPGDAIDGTDFPLVSALPRGRNEITLRTIEQCALAAPG